MKLLLTGAYNYSEKQKAKLQSLGFEIIFVQNELEPVQIKVEDVDVVICNALFKHSNISEFKNLKLIQTTSAGTERLPLDEIRVRKIQLETAKGVYSIPMAEWALLKILEIAKNSRNSHIEQLNHQWAKQRDLMEISDKTAAIIGFGSVGLEIAKRLYAFGVNVLAVDIERPSWGNIDWMKAYYNITDLKIAISKSDIIVLTLPLTPKTFHLIDKQHLAFMKDDAIPINVSRGEIIDEQELIKALQKNKFAGVALDVFENEPLETTSPLWDFENVLITPHNAFVSDKIHQRMFELMVKNLKKFKKGEL